MFLILRGGDLKPLDRWNSKVINVPQRRGIAKASSDIMTKGA